MGEISELKCTKIFWPLLSVAMVLYSYVPVS